MRETLELLVMNNYKKLEKKMCNWRRFFSDAGNYKKNVSWEC